MCNNKISIDSVKDYLENFSLESESASPDKIAEKPKTRLNEITISSLKVPVFTNEFWTAKQRQASSLHEISYRACFKAQLPRFFISLLTHSKNRVYDPFSGRGTTPVEAALLGRVPIANDINPLGKILAEPRISSIPALSEVENRLKLINTDHSLESDIDLSMFYQEDTLRRILTIRNYLCIVKSSETEDNVDRWIRMIATNRLTGHSAGFFSVYTLPPNQATSQKAQIKINQKRKQLPQNKDVDALILKKTRSVLRNIRSSELTNLNNVQQQKMILTSDARETSAIESESINLTVTSPPFLDVIQYAQDNWLRCWFNGIDVKDIESKITVLKKLEDWIDFMKQVFNELYRITKPGGWVAFEVGEVRNGSIKLEEHVVPVGLKSGFECVCVIINEQRFTKTANIWGVDNNSKGTNTNRIALFRKKAQY